MIYAVVGAGMVGLVAARRIQLLHPEAQVVVIEKDAQAGGLLRGTDYPEQGLYFDQGTHIFQETGNKGLDDMVMGAIDEDLLLTYPGVVGDLAGAVLDNRLQSHSHFLDLRRHPKREAVAREIETKVQSGAEHFPPISRTDPLRSVVSQRFGEVFADEIAGPLLSKLYGIPQEDLSGFALLLPGLTRVILDDMDDWLNRTDDNGYRALVAVPDQRELPSALRHNRKSYYSKSLGTKSFIDGLVATLSANGAEVILGATITALDCEESRIDMTLSDGRLHSIAPDRIVLATGAIGAAYMLGIDFASFGFQKPMPHWIVDMVLDQPTETDLCYLYGFDPTCDWYRLTNYRAFSGDENDTRISVEVVGEQATEPENFVETFSSQLQNYGIAKSGKVTFSSVKRLPSGFPAPTTQNMGALSGLAQEVTGALPPSVILAGIGSRDGLFFQNELVLDIYERIESFAA